MAFTFIHAADLHLGAPFRSISAVFQERSGQIRQELQNATFTALNRLVELCLRTGADFLVLAGDVYNVADSSLAAQFALRDAFARLEAAQIPVLLAHGNHDPMPVKAPAVSWPENVHVFGREVGCCEVPLRNGGKALVHGISHAVDKEPRNLALYFSRRAGGPDFQMGVLHCALAGVSEGHGLYAPCSLKDLAATGLDYFALGHVHGSRILGMHDSPGGHPYAAYSGSLQGLHRNEAGPKGCLVVNVDDSGRANPHFMPLAPVVWRDVACDLDRQGAADLGELENLLLERMEECAAEERAFGEQAAARAGVEGAGFSPRVCIFSLEIAGSTALDAELRRPGAAEAFLDRLRDMAEGFGVWVRRIRLLTRPERDRVSDMMRQDLVGEMTRLAETALGDNPEGQSAREAAAEALNEFFRRPKIARMLGEELAAPDDEELKELLREAEVLCRNLLEKG